MNETKPEICNWAWGKRASITEPHPLDKHQCGLYKKVCDTRGKHRCQHCGAAYMKSLIATRQTSREKKEEQLHLTISVLKAQLEDSVELVYVGLWRDTAACSPSILAKPVDFLNEKSAIEAKAICHGCSTRIECLAYALLTKQMEGIWGGYNTPQRRKILTKAMRAGVVFPSERRG